MPIFAARNDDGMKKIVHTLPKFASNMIILSSKIYGVRLKATIQATGHLGFTAGTAQVLDLERHTHIRFAKEDEDSEDLWMAVMPGEDEDGFKILKTGGYFKVNTRSLFEALGVDFTSHTVIYDLVRDANQDEALGGVAYHMSPRYLREKPK